jgi:hypothetical protein
LLFTVTMVIAKFLIWFLRFFGSGGTTLPGRVAARIFPGILPALAKNTDVILITGTNGKTTTGRIISRILEVNNIPHLQNRSGANLVTGITTAFIEASDTRGKLSCGIAVIEADEAAFKKVAPLLSPKVIVITNFFRDQLDRYGELITTVDNVKTGVSGCPDAILVLNETRNALGGKKGRIVAKLNSLVDREIIEYLYDASSAGVDIDLIVRGICCLRPGIPGVSENIRVKSIVGRYLEHSRIYYFYNGGDEQYYLSSADLMERNLDTRVELLFPVEDVDIRERLRSIIDTYLKDDVKARILGKDGVYKSKGRVNGLSCQDLFAREAEEKGTART